MAEIKEAIGKMYPTKSPGPYGLPVLFFQKYWNIVVSQLVFDILNNNTHSNTEKPRLPKGFQTYQFVQRDYEVSYKDNCE